MIWIIFIKNLDECNTNKKRKILIVFDNIIDDMLSNKKLNLMVTELFTRCRKLQKIEFNLPLDIYFWDFINLYKKYTAKPYSFLDINATLASDNLLPFRKNHLERI